MTIDVHLLSGERFLAVDFECNRPPGMLLGSVVAALVVVLRDSYVSAEDGFYEFTLLRGQSTLWHSESRIAEPEEALLDGSVLQLVIQKEQEGGRGVCRRPPVPGGLLSYERALM